MSNLPKPKTPEPVVDYVQYQRGGGCKILESNVSAQRAAILQNDILIFNRENNRQNCYRALVKRS